MAFSVDLNFEVDREKYIPKSLDNWDELKKCQTIEKKIETINKKGEWLFENRQMPSDTLYQILVADITN